MTICQQERKSGNDQIEVLLRKEKNSYVTVQQGVKAYDDYRVNKKMRSHLWILVDPKNGVEYYFKDGKLTPRLMKDGRISINENWEQQHGDTKMKVRMGIKKQ